MTDAGVQGHCAPRFARLRERFERSFREGVELGAAVAVVGNGEPLVDLWGGHRDAAASLVWQRDTLVHVASTTKGVTTTCLHRLVDEGRLDLDAPVARYWPEFAARGKAALPVHMLLSHRAGLPALRRSLPREAAFDWERMTAELAAEAPWWEPGTRHGYHAMTFGWLVGEVLRRIDGRGVGAFLREEIAGPLGLDFHIGLRPAEEARCAEVVPQARGATNPLRRMTRRRDSMLARSFNNPRIRRDEPNSPEWRRSELPAANGHGTARAVARLYAALAVGGEIEGVRVLSREAVERATREQAFGRDAVLYGMTMRFGLGFFLTHPRLRLGPGPRSFGHPGFGGSLGFADPDLGLGFGYVTNRMRSGFAGDDRGLALVDALYACLES